MRGCSRETQIITSLFLDKHSQKALDKIAYEIESNVNYDTTALWELQETLIPYHPHSSMKNFMTPLQCAKDEIDICNININCTYVILYCSKYLEEVMKFFLSVIHPVMKLKYKITPFGNLIKKLGNHDFIPKYIIEGSEQLYCLNRKCLDNPDVDLSPKDAVTFYICSMLLGCRLLEFSDQYLKNSENKCTDNLYKLDTRN